MQERRNSIANALELRLACTNPSIFSTHPSNFLWDHMIGKWSYYSFALSKGDDNHNIFEFSYFQTSLKPDVGPHERQNHPHWLWRLLRSGNEPREIPWKDPLPTDEDVDQRNGGRKAAPNQMKKSLILWKRYILIHKIKCFICFDSICPENLWSLLPTAHLQNLTHWTLDKMVAISLTIFSGAFLWMKTFAFWLKFHWSLFLMVQLTISQHCFR